MYTVADKTRVHDFSLIFLLLDLAVFITKGDVGVGTIVGSAVFNILVIIGICGIFAGQVRTLQSTPCCLTESSQCFMFPFSLQPIALSWWPLFRDAVFYILSIVVLILVRNLYSTKLSTDVKS